MLEENLYTGHKAELAAGKTRSLKATTTTMFRVYTEDLEELYAKTYILPVNCLPRLTSTYHSALLSKTKFCLNSTA
jgi:hypothetical protein